jgi:K+-transporting ATPase ATPase A chain
VAVLLPDALASRLNHGSHGFSEILYGFASPGNNNGSAFGGLTGNTTFYNVTQAIAMLVGRFLLIVPVLGLAGSLGRKPAVPPSSGTFPTHTPLFGVLLIGVVVIVALLTFFPALALGPIVEALG